MVVNKLSRPVLNILFLLSRFFFLHLYMFLYAPPQFSKFRNWPWPFIWKRNRGYWKSGSGSVLRIHQSGTESFFFMKECSGSKFCINYWFMDCWIRKPNSVTDWCIQNVFFFNYEILNPMNISVTDLWIHNVFFNDEFLNVKCIFWITDWWIKKISEVPIQNFSEFHNHECKKINRVQLF